MQTKIGYWMKTGHRAALLRVAAMIAFLCASPQIGLGETDHSSGLTPNVEEFLALLGKSDVQDWLRARQGATGASGNPKDRPSNGSFGEALSERVKAIRTHFIELWHLVPRMGVELRDATLRLQTSSGGASFFTIFATAGLLTGLGLTAQSLVKVRLRKCLPDMAHCKTLGLHRRQVMGRSLVREAAGVIAFCIAGLGPVLFYERAPIADFIVLTLLAAVTGWILLRGALDVLFSTVEERDEGNRSHFWPLAAAGWFLLGVAITETSRLSGMDPLASTLISYIMGVGLVTIAIAIIWQTSWIEVWHNPKSTKNSALLRWVATFVVLGFWSIWVAGAMHLFWPIAIGLATAWAIKGTTKLARHLFPLEHDQAESQLSSAPRVMIETFMRAFAIALALWTLAWLWGIGFSQLTTSDDPISRLTRASLIVVAILFAFSALWQFMRLAIDTKITQVDKAGLSSPDRSAKQARLRTLLPVARNFAMVMCATLALLMTLSTLGIAIGPLLASAGVVGLAVGFGAQTLVKDIISGVFYLLDDAFRVGEYIQSGNYSGTVESFSLRSVRLRHQNGPIFTIPFSALGAVQNGSRDYAIDKFLVTVSYDTDLEKARKLVKRVGEQMMEDPQLAPMIIEPLKMNAVGDFGAYGIQLKLKATTKPGFQSTVRKRAYPLIKVAFDENGIEFAHPTVKVSEGVARKTAAGLQHVLEADADPEPRP